MTAKLIAEGGVSTMWPQSAGESLYWTELRPLENGRYVVVRRAPDGEIADVTPPGVSARTLVHEYGGGMYVAFIGADGAESVIFSDQADQRLYRQDLRPAGEAQPAHWTDPRPLTPAPPAERAHRYADGRVTPDGRLLVTVRERHEAGGEVVNELVSLPTDGSAEPRVIASGHDFYAAPRLSPDGRRLAWLSWDHPRMPWDGTELWTAELAGDGTRLRRAAGGRRPAGVHPAAALESRRRALVRERPHRLVEPVRGRGRRRGRRGEARADGLPEPCPLVVRDAEFVKVPWVFGLQHYVFLADGTLAVSYTEDGRDHLAVLDAAPAGAERGPRGIGAPRARLALQRRLLARPARRPPRRSSPASTPRACRSPSSIRAPATASSSAGAGRSSSTRRTSAARRRSPSPRRAASARTPTTTRRRTRTSSRRTGELPPLLVNVHGGPTSDHEAMLDLDVQYWTSRGIAVVDVNYGGSTGYGREYRERLRGEWGVVDTVDSINAARYLVARGDADPARLGVRGGSAGGYTTLNALTRFDVFSAGASLFGLADLEAFATGGTHKFESRYLDSLLGPYPERRDVYRERSPIHHVDDISCPVILLQGLEDVIVPPAQADIIVEAMRRKGLPFAYIGVRGRAARLPQGGEHHPLPGGRAVLLRTRLGLHAGRRDRAGRDREPRMSGRARRRAAAAAVRRRARPPHTDFGLRTVSQPYPAAAATCCSAVRTAA